MTEGAPPTEDADAAFEARKLAFAAITLDFQERFDALAVSGKDPVIPPHIADFLKTSSVGVILGYQLVKRLDLVEWIVSLSAERALEALTYLAGCVQRDLDWCELPHLWWLAPSVWSFWELCTVESIESEMRLARLCTWSPSPDSRPN